VASFTQLERGVALFFRPLGSGRRAMMTGDTAFTFVVLLLLGLLITMSLLMIGIGLQGGL
jgi:hypothetical protein